MNNLLRSKFFTVLSLVLAGFLGFLILEGRPQIEGLDEEIVELEQKVLDAENKTETLKSEFEYFKSDVYLERQARLKLNLKKPGEFVAYIVRDNEIASQSEAEIEEKPLFSRILDFIFKRD